ncbi:MAG: hypothetical protein ACR2PL_20190 [Dehalococcoidia bacterium]
MSLRGTDSLDERGLRIISRAKEHVILLYEHGWEDEYGLVPVSEPIPFSEWIATTLREGYRVEWVPQGAVVEGPYRGGVVVEIVDEHGRSYVAVPPERLDSLRELMTQQDYQMVREDAASLDNPLAAGVFLSLLDSAAWEQRQQTVSLRDLSAEVWARTVREKGLQIELTPNGTLPIESRWPAGHVVRVLDRAGRREYYAAPRPSLWLAIELAAEAATRAAHARTTPASASISRL